MRAAATNADDVCRQFRPDPLFILSQIHASRVLGIHQGGFSLDELFAYRPTIHKNVLDSDQAAILAVHKIGVNPVRFGNCVLVDNITDGRRSSRLRSRTQSIIPKIMDEHRSEFYLMDSATYFTKVLIHMLDVGAQRSERKKWIHCFESVTSIIFCTALSKYDQVLLEARDQNHTKEALVLFDSVINLHVHLLFLSKMDVFKTKLLKIPLLPRSSPPRSAYLPFIRQIRDAASACHWHRDLHRGHPIPCDGSRLGVYRPISPHAPVPSPPEARRRRRAPVDGSDGSTRAPSSEQTARRPFMLPSMRPCHRRPKRAVGGAPKLIAVMTPLGHQDPQEGLRAPWGAPEPSPPAARRRRRAQADGSDGSTLGLLPVTVATVRRHPSNGCPLLHSGTKTFKTPFVLPSKRPSHRRPQRAADGAPKLMVAMAPLGHQERTFENPFKPPGVRPCHRRPKRTVVVTPSFMALSEESDTKTLQGPFESPSGAMSRHPLQGFKGVIL
ncbi:G-protein alpha subunit-domain-containing protein [Mycena rosella]|uniref:G-protein alpha subunit-domain-containing protein n=1 Tax=Mycena rosella TaxID=1033263 RepID=A0AAD7BST7_MYCRO|nr:G-protein alpha subunit-domain-containing protein [Mycena rosella]